ncbi:stimulated by retinoic acid gene 6 protein-like isoform X1 [Crassostrea virginica]
MENQTWNASSTVHPLLESLDTCLEVSTAVFQGVGLPLYAIGATLIISFFERRRYKAGICYGRPGLPLPINFLDGTSNSVANAAAVGCTLQHIVYYTFVVKIIVNRWLISLFLFFLSFLVALVFYPVFACLNSSSRKFGSIAGFLYTLLLSAVVTGQNIICTLPGWEWGWAIYAVTLICELYLLGLFAYRFITAIFKKSKNQKETLVKFDQIYHVKNLLHRPKTLHEEKDIRTQILDQSKRVLDEAKLCCLHKSLYRFTTRTLVINTIVFLVFYYIFILTIKYGEVLDVLLSSILSFLNGTELSKLSTIQVLSKQITIFASVLRVSWMLSNLLSGVYLIVNMVLIYRSQREHLYQIWRGERSFIPSNCRQDHREMLVKNLMYTGNQVSHLLGGFLISQLVILLICFILAYLLILPLMGEVPGSFLVPVEIIIPPIIFMFLIRFALRYISGRFFLQNHYVKSADGESLEKALALDNRRVYQNFSYFLFFYYILIGFIRCLFRVLTSSALGLFYIARLDKPLVFAGFERFDIGYMTYLSFLEVELHHCHPVVLVTCDLMLKTAARKFISSPQQQISLESPVIENNKIDFSNTYTRKVRNRWLKTKTLISNRCLCEYSKTNTAFHYKPN